MVEKVHSVEPLQYILTQLADLTQDDKTTTALVKAAQELVQYMFYHMPLSTPKVPLITIDLWGGYIYILYTHVYMYNIVLTPPPSSHLLCHT